MGLELGKPADQSVFIGLETEEHNHFQALPFYAGATDEAKRFAVENKEQPSPAFITSFPRHAIRRDFQLATDTWQAGDLTFSIYSPVHPIPDPKTASAEDLQLALAPAVLVEITVNNTSGKNARRAYFGFNGNDPYSGMRRLDDTTAGALVGVGQGRHVALVSRGQGIRSGLGFAIDPILAPDNEANLAFALGMCGSLIMEAPPGKTSSWTVAVCFYRGDVVTAGVDTKYFYTRYFQSIEEVATYALAHAADYKRLATEANSLLANSRLSSDQQFMLAHAVRSYYGSTELLETTDHQPFWVVNEGEYRMMNTFDLTVDQLFFELRMNPWTVRNVLDMFAQRFSYRDTVHFLNQGQAYPGGVSFTHDMGVANTISRPGYSAYEIFGSDKTFSHMTHEQLVNWICCALVYYNVTRDDQWLVGKMQLLEACLESLVHRDHPDPAQRNGLMGLDSSRTKAEITTYDSLDASLGQARNNLYLAVKTWAAYVLLERIFVSHNRTTLAQIAASQARQGARTIVAHVTSGGYIPAVLDEGNDSRIIPAIEGLVFPWVAGYRDLVSMEGPYGALIKALRRHLEVALQPGICLFVDGGWKISSTSDNSWLSKIYLCQFVARAILGQTRDQQGRAADAAHVQWLLDPENAYWAWSDQMVKGKVQGSRYYPRGVTAILWLSE